MLSSAALTRPLARLFRQPYDIAFGSLLVAVAILLVAKWLLLDRIAIQGDEFNYLNHIYDRQRGQLSAFFQRFHVYFFAWVPAVNGNEADQVLAARQVAYGMRLAATAAIFLIARKLYGTMGALLAVCLSLSFGHVLRHGEAFRYDSWISGLFLIAACLLILRPRSLIACAMAGGAMALAAAFSVKAAIYVPSLLLILLALGLFGQGGVGGLKAVLLFALTGVIALAALLFWHGGQLPGLSQELAQQFSTIGQQGARLFTPSRILPRGQPLINSLQSDPVHWGLIIAGGLVALRDLFRRGATPDDRQRGLLLLALAAPLGTLLIYNNAWEYYYVCLIPPAAVLAAFLPGTLQRLAKRRPRWALFGGCAIAAGLIFTTLAHLWHHRIDRVAHQRTFIDTVRTLFPEPVPYLDRCRMIASYPPAHNIITTATLRPYRARNKPIMRNKLIRHQPKFLIANTPTLALGASWEQMQGSRFRLLEEDFRILQDNFVNHWGRLYVAGREFTALGEAPRRFDLIIAGQYTVESDAAIVLDGKRLAPGAVTELRSGPHTIGGTRPGQAAILRIGDNLPIPSHAPSSLPLVNA